jgi:hypothetical protein
MTGAIDFSTTVRSTGLHISGIGRKAPSGCRPVKSAAIPIRRYDGVQFGFRAQGASFCCNATLENGREMAKLWANEIWPKIWADTQARRIGAKQQGFPT